MHHGGHHHRPRLIYRYSRLNLNYDEYGLLEDRRVLRGRRSVTMFWWEKISWIVWWCQIHAILWTISKQQWSWPSYFLYYSRLSQIFVLDFVGIATEDGAGSAAAASSSYNNYVHSWVIVLLPLLSLAIYYILKTTVYADATDDANSFAGDNEADRAFDDESSSEEDEPAAANASNAEKKKLNAAKAKHARDHATNPHDEFEDSHNWISFLDFERTFNTINEWLYVPLLIIAFRVWICDSNDKVIYIDPNMTCRSGSHFALLGATMVVSAIWLVAYPAMLFFKTRKLLVFGSGDATNVAGGGQSNHASGASGDSSAALSGAAQHERYLQSREIEYLLGCNTLYESLEFQLIGNYHRAWAYARFYLCVQKVALVATVYVLGPYVVNLSKELQGVVFFVLVSLAPTLKLVTSQFRVASTNHVRFSLDWVISLMALIGLFSAAGFRSALLIEPNLQRILFSLNFIGFFFACFSMFWAWYKRASWPITPDVVEEIYLGNETVVKALNLGKRLIENAQSCPYEFFPLHHVEDTIIELRKVINQLRVAAADDAAGKRKVVPGAVRLLAGRELSADELKKKRGERQSRVLEWTLIDMLEDLADLHYNISSSQHTRLKGAAEHKRYETVQRALAGLTVALEKRRVERQMMRAPKRRVLNKLLVLRALLGDDFTYNVARPDWILPEEPEPEHAHKADTASGAALGSGAAKSGIGRPSSAAADRKHATAPMDAARLRVEAEDEVTQLTPAPHSGGGMNAPNSGGLLDRSGGSAGLALGSVRARRATSRADRDTTPGSGTDMSAPPLPRTTSFNRASIGMGPVSAAGVGAGAGGGGGAASGNLQRRSKTFTGQPIVIPAPGGGVSSGLNGSPAADDPTAIAGARFNAATASPAPGISSSVSTPSGVNVAMRPTPAINRPFGRGLSGRNMRIDTGGGAGSGRTGGGGGGGSNERTLSPAIAMTRPVTPPISES